MPGGHVEDGESFVEAAVCETKEETGREIKISRLVVIYSCPNWFDGNHEIVFADLPIGGQLQVDNTETVEIGYFDLSALPQPLLAWNAAHIVDTFAEEHVVVRNQDIRFPLENITRRDLAALRKQDKIPFTRKMVSSLCTPLSPEKNRREIGE